MPWIPVGFDPNSLDLVRSDSDYTADYGEHVVTDGAIITLPEPSQDEMVMVSKFDEADATIDSVSGSVEAETDAILEGTEPVVFVSDGVDWWNVSGFNNLGDGIPDSAVHHYDVTELSASDGGTVTTIPDQIGSADLTGTGTYRESALNGNPTVELDGVDDEFDAPTPAISFPNTIYLVGEFLTSNDSVIVSFENANSTNTTHNITLISGNNEIFAGNALAGSSGSVQQTTSLFDGANSILREEGTQTASGDAGGRTTAENLRVGSLSTDGNLREQAFFSELVICDGDDVDQSFESSLLSKWGI